MGFRIVAVMLVLLGAAGLSQAQNWNRNGGNGNDPRWDRGNGRGNDDVSDIQRRACEPEVFRLCSRHIPNRDAITACLNSNIDQLAPDCRAVMEGRLR